MAFSKLHISPVSLKHPRPHFHLDFAYAQYERRRIPSKRRVPVLRTQEVSLSLINSMPIDVLYEIFAYLHPRDVLNLSRSTHRLRQLLMTRDAKFVWQSALSNVHGFPFCPSDLSEPQFASLAFDEECHFCRAPRVKDALWSCRKRCCQKCIPKWFLTHDQLVPLLSKTLNAHKPETIFPHTTYPSSNSGLTATTLFYKPTVEAYLRELPKLDKERLSHWCKTKRALVDETMSHAALCEHWAAYLSPLETSHQIYDFGFTLCLLGLLVFLWKDELF